MTVIINGTTGVTFPDVSDQTTAATGFGFKNRIINGAMMIDQRNAGAAVTTSASFPVDRFRLGFSMDGACSMQQVTDAPTGFINSIRFTTTTADTNLGTSQSVLLQHRIEGNNVSDLGWGTANAQTVTLSFWTKSSLTGTFGGSIQNSASNRSYPFSYTISSANTWEQKSITIAGDATGTWLTDTNIGIRLVFSLGAGSSLVGTAGAWSSSDLVSSTGATSVIGTLNATWQITGVQLEKGSTATSFDYRPYGTELALCQRYYEVCSGGWYGYASGASQRVDGSYIVTKRVAPTLTASSTSENFVTAVVLGAGYDSLINWRISGTTVVTGSEKYLYAKFGASAEL